MKKIREQSVKKTPPAWEDSLPFSCFSNRFQCIFSSPFSSAFPPFRESLIPALQIEGHTQIDNAFGPMLLKREKRTMLLLASSSLVVRGDQRPSVGQRAPSSAGQRLCSAGKTELI